MIFGKELLASLEQHRLKFRERARRFVLFPGFKGCSLLLMSLGYRLVGIGNPPGFDTCCMYETYLGLMFIVECKEKFQDRYFVRTHMLLITPDLYPHW
jgi:hypothetical protein